MNASEPLSVIGITNARSSHLRFGLRQPDRLHHLYVIGKTGTGKSTLLETLALQDIRAGRGLAVIDPHGDLAERLVRQVPEERKSALAYFDAPNPSQPYGYNPLRGVRPDFVPLAASGLLEAFKKLWPDAWGNRMEHVLRNALYALLEYGKATLPDVLRVLDDPSFRGQVLRRVKNEQVRRFWLQEFPRYNPRYRQEMIAPIQNKVGALLADPRLYRIFTAPPIDLSFRRAMDRSEIIIVNLAKGTLGEDSANLLGALLVTTFGLAGLSRAALPSAERCLFFLYIDEFQSFTTLSVANMVSELRKHAVGLVLAHQHLHQLGEDVRKAVLGNVGSFVAFRLGAEDAPLLAREFAPVFDAADLVQLKNHDCYVKLLIDGIPSRPFSATTLPPSVLEGG
jgi:energy-coupling factor transporter ATP-binding protein EcfA2